MGPSFASEDVLPGSVAGIDEVGRGPWAGPVVACAVVLDRARVPEGLRDSKTLSAGRREALAAEIEAAAAVGIGEASVAEIDEVGVGRATLTAMERALGALPFPPDSVLVDGVQVIAVPPGVAIRALPRADALSPSVAAASIVAKVHRDALMMALDAEWPAYGWVRNKGYGTAQHADALARHGVTPHHRRSFAPVARRLRCHANDDAASPQG